MFDVMTLALSWPTDLSKLFNFLCLLWISFPVNAGSLDSCLLYFCSSLIKKDEECTVHYFCLYITVAVKKIFKIFISLGLHDTQI